MKELEYPWYSSGAGSRRVSWGAVFAGAVTSLSIMFTLLLLGVGIGLYPAAAAATVLTATVHGFWRGAWLFGSGVISYYSGGWVAGRLNGIARVDESVIHGLVSWGIATLATAAVMIATGAFGAVATLGGSLLYFFLQAIEGAVACLGARDGTCVLKPVARASAPHREHAGV